MNVPPGQSRIGRRINAGMRHQNDSSSAGTEENNLPIFRGPISTKMSRLRRWVNVASALRADWWPSARNRATGSTLQRLGDNDGPAVFSLSANGVGGEGRGENSPKRNFAL
jgi:hypothetical protein